MLMTASLVSSIFITTGEAQAEWRTEGHADGPTSAYANQTVAFSFQLTNTGDQSFTISSAVYTIDWGTSTTSTTLKGDLTVSEGGSTNLTGSFTTPEVAPGVYSGTVAIEIKRTPLDLLESPPRYDLPFTIKEVPVLDVSIQASPDGDNPLDMDLAATVTGGIGPYTYAWDAGDGSTASTSNFEHQYAAAGQYTISLTVTDSRGATATNDISIDAGKVVAGNLTVSIQATTTNGPAPLTVNVTSVVTGGVSPYTYSWTLGDGGASSGDSFTHTYQGANTYTVRLLVTDAAGNTGRDMITITVLSQSNQTVGPVVESTLPIGPTVMIYLFAFVIASAAVVGFMIYHNSTRFRR